MFSFAIFSITVHTESGSTQLRKILERRKQRAENGDEGLGGKSANAVIN